MAVGMNIDIASIDMVSEVNMVSINVPSYASAILHLGMGECRHWGCGMLEYMYGIGTGTWYFALEFCSYRTTPSGLLPISQIGFNTVSEYRVSKRHHTCICKRQQYAGGPLQNAWFSQLLEHLRLSSDNSGFGDQSWEKEDLNVTGSLSYKLNYHKETK